MHGVQGRRVVFDAERSVAETSFSKILALLGTDTDVFVMILPFLSADTVVFAMLLAFLNADTVVFSGIPVILTMVLAFLSCFSMILSLCMQVCFSAMRSGHETAKPNRVKSGLRQK